VSKSWAVLPLLNDMPVVQKEMTFYSKQGDNYANKTLLRDGYLGSSPLQPTVAFSVRTLAAYRQAHRTCPRFSIEAQCRMLSHLHNVGSSLESVSEAI
jgi:CxC1 like cysteine cluster associated with KDZ transposases